MDPDPIDAWVDAGAVLLGLPVDEHNRARVLTNLRQIRSIAAALEAVPLEPAVEPLQVFVR